MHDDHFSLASDAASGPATATAWLRVPAADRALSSGEAAHSA